MENKVKNLLNEIVATVEHGECFYDKQMLDDLFSDINDFKYLALKEFESNNKE